MTDPLRPAKGIATGLALSVALWIVIAFVVGVMAL